MPIIRDTAILLLSLCAFSALHIMQYGSKLLLAAYILFFIFAYFTKKDKSLFSKRPRLGDTLAAAAVLLLEVAYGFTSTAYSNSLQNMGVNISPASTLALSAGIAILSVPSLLFIASWLRETTPNKLIDTLSALLTGRLFLWLCVSISLIGLIVLGYYSFSYSIWLDEAYSLSIIDSGYDKLVSVTAVDVHPPLYYIQLKLFIQFLQWIFPGMPGIFAAKLLSVIPYIILLIVSITRIRKTWGNYAAGTAAVALCCMPPLLAHGVNIRMYSWALLWVVCCYLQAYQITRKNTVCNWLIFSLYGLLAAYTNYWACITVAFIYLYIGIWSLRQGKDTLLKWGMALVLSGIGYLPWLYYFVCQFLDVSSGSCPWHTEVTIKGYSLMIMFGQNMLNLLIIALSAALITEHIRKANHNDSIFSLTGVSIPGLVILSGAIIGLLLAPSLSHRHLLPSYACMWLGVCLISALLPNKRWKIFAAFTILAVSVVEISILKQGEQVKSRDSYALLKKYRHRTPTAFVTRENAYFLPLTQLMPEHPVYIYNRKLRNVTKKSFDKNKLYELEDTQPIEEMLNQGVTVYYIAMDGDDAAQFTQGTSYKLKHLDTYELDLCKWIIYQVEKPDGDHS